MNKYLTYICVASFLLVGASCSTTTSSVNSRINNLETALWHNAIDEAGRSASRSFRQ